MTQLSTKPASYRTQLTSSPIHCPSTFPFLLVLLPLSPSPPLSSYPHPTLFPLPLMHQECFSPSGWKRPNPAASWLELHASGCASEIRDKVPPAEADSSLLRVAFLLMLMRSWETCMMNLGSSTPRAKEWVERQWWKRISIMFCRLARDVAFQILKSPSHRLPGKMASCAY